MTQNISQLTNISAFDNLMGSREIAELTEKRHADVMRDIRKMLDELGDEATNANLRSLNFKISPNLDASQNSQKGFSEKTEKLQPNDADATDPNLDRLKIKKSSYIDKKGESRTEYLLNFELTMTLIAGYNVKLRNRIIQRWQQLELQQHQQQLTKQSKQLLALENKLQDAQIKARQFDALVAQSGFLNFRKVAKELELNERSLKSWLIQNDWISLRGSQKKMSPKSWTIRKKYMVFKHQLTESGDISTYPMALFSYKGIKEIQRRLMTLGLHAHSGLFEYSIRK